MDIVQSNTSNIMLYFIPIDIAFIMHRSMHLNFTHKRDVNDRVVSDDESESHC